MKKSDLSQHFLQEYRTGFHVFRVYETGLHKSLKWDHLVNSSLYKSPLMADKDELKITVSETLFLKIPGGRSYINWESSVMPCEVNFNFKT